MTDAQHAARCKAHGAFVDRTLLPLVAAFVAGGLVVASAANWQGAAAAQREAALARELAVTQQVADAAMHAIAQLSADMTQDAPLASPCAQRDPDAPARVLLTTLARGGVL